MTQELEDYITHHLGREPEYLAATFKETWRYRLYPRMCSGWTQGSFLAMLTSMVKPERVLELGTYSGYSAMAIASAMGPGTELHTVEIDEEHEEFILRQLDRFPGPARIELHVGDALEIVPAMECREWDMVFIDANKRHYPQYYRMVKPLVKAGGYIIADNTLWDGKVAHPDAATDPQSRGIMEFNSMVAADDEVSVSIVPMRDGLTIIRKK